MKNRLACLLMLCLLLLSAALSAHEVRPAALDISWQGADQWQVRWRQPVLGEYTIAIAPALSSGWLQREPDSRIVTNTSLIYQWQINAVADALAGQNLTITGLDRTITDVLVQVSFADGRQWSALVKAANPGIQIPASGNGLSGTADYLRLGFAHIWKGADHLLYVLALILLIQNRRSLVLTITAFTLAHSITLVVAVLGLVSLRPAPVEAVIALSIVYVAVEAVKAGRKQHDLGTRMPWLIAFVFGLLHGFGFAGALQEIGLPDSALALALFLFNLGIELGQLLFVALVLLLLWALRRVLPLLHRYFYKGVPYLIGSMASFWLIQRLLLIAY